MSCRVIGISGWKAFRAILLSAIGMAMVAASPGVMADNFGSVRYDPADNQLVVVMIYRGTSPDHHFSVKWGRCRTLIDQIGEPPHQIIQADIVDDQGNDAARTNYSKTIRLSLAGLSCRPATVTLWTPPRHFRSLNVPYHP